MEQNSKNVPVWYKNEEEQQLAEYLIGLEKAALDKWFDGDTSGYEQLWSKHSFTYFDSVSDKRVDDHETIAQFLKTIDANCSPKATISVCRVCRLAKTWLC